MGMGILDELTKEGGCSGLSRKRFAPGAKLERHNNNSSSSSGEGLEADREVAKIGAIGC